MPEILKTKTKRTTLQHAILAGITGVATLLFVLPNALAKEAASFVGRKFSSNLKEFYSEYGCFVDIFWRFSGLAISAKILPEFDSKKQIPAL